MGAPAAGTPQGAGQPGNYPGNELLQHPQFQQYHQALVAELSQVLDSKERQSQAQIAELEKKLQAARAPAQPGITPELNQHLAEKMLSDPTRFFGEYTQALRGEWQKELQAEREKVQRQAEQEQWWGQFWNEVAHHNQDMRENFPLVQALFPQALSQHPSDPSAAVNSVIGYLRGRFAQERATAEEMERRKRQQQQALSTGPGVQALLGALNPQTQATSDDDRDDPNDYIAELNAVQDKRMARNWGWQPPPPQRQKAA